jgi:hypothetical protein
MAGWANRAWRQISRSAVSLAPKPRRRKEIRFGRATEGVQGSRRRRGVMFEVRAVTPARKPKPVTANAWPSLLRGGSGDPPREV